jgi:hypothetical protein
MEGLIMSYLLMLSSNAICDVLGVKEAHDRGLVRMLVNALLWTAACLAMVLTAWKMVG